MFDPNHLQVLREYIYGPTPRPRMFGLRHNHKKWIFLKLGDPSNLYESLPHYFKLCYLAQVHIAGTHFINKLSDTVEMVPNPTNKIISKVADPKGYNEFGLEYPSVVCGVWAISLEGKWQRLLRRLPSIEELISYQKDPTYSRIRIYVYTSSLLCLESLEINLLKPDLLGK